MTKIWKPLAFMALFFSVCRPSFARDEDESLRRLTKTRSTAQLGRLIGDGQRARRLRLVCDAQLRSARVPDVCFELLKVGEEAKPAKEDAWLERLCVSRAGSSRNWRELRTVANNKFVPAKCREAALRRQDDLNYVDQAVSPADVFVRDPKPGAVLE